VDLEPPLSAAEERVWEWTCDAVRGAGALGDVEHLWAACGALDVAAAGATAGEGHEDLVVAAMHARQLLSGIADRRAGRTHEACPCCGSLTLRARDNHEICGVCWWEDDPEQSSGRTGVGSNPLALADARACYERTGASFDGDRRHARPPFSFERPR
jgi:hypothetical protein